MRQTTLILIILTLLLFTKCTIDNKSRKTHKRTTEVCNKLYVETFSVFGQGAFGGDLDSDWLTDSTNFRIYIGTYDEVDGGISFKCNGDTIDVTQKPDATADSPKKVSVTKLYNISDLRKKHNLNDN